MVYTVDTPIIGKPVGSPRVVIDWLTATSDEIVTQAVRDYVTELYRLCGLVGINADLLAAQSAHETADWTSYWWKTRKNPAGLGITGDEHQNMDSQTWQSGVEAARAHVIHMFGYTMAGQATPEVLKPFFSLDRRFAHVLDQPWAGDIRTLKELTGKWATDRQYAQKIVAKANSIFRRSTQEEPMAALIFRQAKHPPFIDRLIPDSQNRAWNNLGPRRIVGTCRHTEVGTNEGTDGWFRRGAASTGLTDYGVSLAGIILRWNDPTGAAHPGVSANRAGWANGGSDGLEGDGPLFVRTRGIDAINRDLVSIEREDLGDPYDTAFEGPQFEAIAQLTAYWHDQAEVPWDRFPFNPNIGCVTDFHHLEFATKGCPHDPVTSKVNQFQDRVRALLKAAQTATDGVPTQPIPSPVEVDHGAWPNGWKESDLAARWAAPRYVDLAGKRKALRFQPNGPLPNAWVARGVAEGIARIADLPKCVRIVEVAAPDSGMVSTMAIFDGRGSDNWAAYRPAAHVSWRWVQ